MRGGRHHRGDLLRGQRVVIAGQPGPLARQVLVRGEVPDCKLGTLAAYFETPAAPSHRALADARATAAVLDVLITRLALLGVRTLDDLSDWLAIP